MTVTTVTDRTTTTSTSPTSPTTPGATMTVTTLAPSDLSDLSDLHDPPAAGPGRAQVIRADRPAGVLATATTVAGRTVRKFVRTPQQLVLGTVTGAMFLLIFRY